MAHEIYQQRKMYIVGLQTQFLGTQIPKLNLEPLWQDFMKRVDEIKNKTGDKYYGLVKVLNKDTKLIEYHCGTEVTTSDPPPEGMVLKEVEPATYAKFTYQGPSAGLETFVKDIYMNWLPQSKLERSPAPDIEIYEKAFNPKSATSVMYYAVAVNQKSDPT